MSEKKKSGSNTQKNDVKSKLNTVRGGSTSRVTRQTDGGDQKSSAKTQKTKTDSKAKNTKAKTSGKSGAAAALAALNEKQKSMIIRITLIVLGVLVLLYASYHMYSCFSKIETKQTSLITLVEKVETQGVAIRNEQIITSDRSGVMVSTVANGGKVSKGETFANIFNSTAAAEAYARMEEIERKLEEFDSMSTAGEENASEVSTLEKQLKSRLLTFSDYIHSGEIEKACSVSDDILYTLNKSQIATKVTESFDLKIAQLKEELQQLKKQYPDKPSKLTSPYSGYYINDADGYESLLNIGIIDSLTPERMDEILDARVATANNSAVGKIADDYVWYLACEVSGEDIEKFETDKEYKIYLAYSETDSITVRLVSKNTGADANRCLLIFRCSYMIPDLSSVRVQPVTIEISRATGLQVSRSSLTTRTKEKKTTDENGNVVIVTEEQDGVFVQLTNEIKFRRVEIIASVGDRVVCRFIRHDEEGITRSEWLKLYDSVVVDPEGVYDGQIVS